MCSAIALIYGGNAFANTYGDNEEELVKSQESYKGDDVQDFGTKDQWQNFFESQGEPQRRYFVSPEKAEASRKRRREKMDFLIKQLESLKSPDDVALLTNKLKKLKIENEDATGKLIDIGEEGLHHSKKASFFDSDQNDDRFNNEKSEEFVVESIRTLRNSSKAEGSLKPDVSQKLRAKLKPSRIQTEPNAMQGTFAR